ncbi:BTB/POZ domain-containing protein At1g67900 isoform X2 [Dioscorea cayenensis subsp. rotundata]|uniref:BTB/POZ domain-containing protein At1g67900 isoform X2 n=1 Tax=Dioscorea cayennensis subsp. rotundata TaxID=55577 RepID=A0AB40C1Q5_DIOCR|nr:BTB/POZ domain-containing protein At1g67900 isoform X2 [Dioscorea cayenensis subsp. rotundata]
MKFMKLGTRPDTFFTTEAIRSVSSEVTTDLKIQVQNSLYLLHKFPLLSKCQLLQKLVAETKNSSSDIVLHLPDIPGGAEAFEQCAKFCYSITITLSALNIVSVRCAAEYLGMTEEVDRGNLVSKLDVFLKSCILHRWKDTLVVLQSTKQYPELSEKLRITSQCIEAIASMIINKRPTGKGWWAEDIAQLGIDLYWRIMVAVKSSGSVPDKVIGGALKVYACKWLPTVQRKQVPEINSSCMGSFQEITSKHRLILERIVSLLPMDKGSVSCSFLLKLLKSGNILNSSSSSKMELVRKVGMQLDEATVTDLLIPSLSYNDETLYDVDLVISILEEFMLQGQSPRTSPTRGKFGGIERRRRSRSAEDIDFEGVQENSRRSSSASHGSKLRVAKLIDGYLQEIAKDANLPMEKVIALAEAVPDFARQDHDDLYRVIDTYLRAHQDLDKSERKRLCRILNCKKLSVEACMHAAQNELLPLRMVVQVLFFEQTRAAMNGGEVTELPQSLKALLAKTNYVDQGNKRTNKMPNISNAESFDDDWSMPGFKTPRSKLATLKMKLAEADNDVEEDVMQCDSLGRSGSSRFKSICSIPSKPKRILSKLWAMNRSVSERN